MDVLGLGDCTLEHIALVETLPRGDSEQEIPKFTIQGGGTTATAIAALARWDLASRFVGKVGDDDRGSQIEQTLADEGVDTGSMIAQTDGISQFSFTVLARQTGKHQTFFTHGDIAPLAPDEVDFDSIEKADLLLCDDTEPSIQKEALRRASEAGVQTLLRANEPLESELADCLADCDIFTTSEKAASQFTGKGELEDMCRALLSEGPQLVVMTLGSEGLAGMSRVEDQLIRLSAIDVPVVDTTGAGGIHAGALAYGLFRDWSVRQRLEFANAAAGLSCRGLGARSAIPSVDEVERHIRD